MLGWTADDVARVLDGGEPANTATLNALRQMPAFRHYNPDALEILAAEIDRANTGRD